MEKQFTTANSETYRKYDEDFFDVQSLFPGVVPDLYRFDLSQTHELAAVRCSEEIEDDNLRIRVCRISPIRADEHTRSVEPDSLKFLNLEEYTDSTKTGSKTDTSVPNWPTLSCTSANPLEETSAAVSLQQESVHQDHYERANNMKFHLAVDTPTQTEHQSLPKYSVRSDDVGAHCVGGTPAINKVQKGNHTNLLPATGKVRSHETVPCPRCQSVNTKFCYYNNYNRNQPRHFCRSCKTQWTVGGILRSRPSKSKSGQTVRRRRKSSSSRLEIGDGRGSGTKERGEQALGCGDLLTTGNSNGVRQRHPNKVSTRSNQPIPGGTQEMTLQQGGGRKRKAGPSSVHVPASELSILNYSSGPGETSSAASRITSLNFPQWTSISDLRINEGALPPCLTASFTRPSSVKKVAIQLGNAQIPRISADVDEPGPGFQGFTPTAAASPVPYSDFEVTKEYGPFRVSAIYKLKDTPLATPNFIRHDLPFEDVGQGSSRLEREHVQDRTEMGTSVGTDRNDSYNMSDIATGKCDLNLKAPTTESILRDLITHPAMYMSSALESRKGCQLDRPTCTCGAPSDCMKKTKQFPSRLGIN